MLPYRHSAPPGWHRSRSWAGTPGRRWAGRSLVCTEPCWSGIFSGGKLQLQQDIVMDHHVRNISCPTFCGAPGISACSVAPVPGAGVQGDVVKNKRKLAAFTLVSCTGDSLEQHQHPPHPPHPHQPCAHSANLTIL